MKKIITIKLARALRASICAQIAQLENITEALAHTDLHHNPSDQLSDAQLLNDHVERATEVLARADLLLATYIPASSIFSSPPAPITWLMRQLRRIKE